VIGRDRVLEVFCTAPMEVLGRAIKAARIAWRRGQIAQCPRDGGLREQSIAHLVLATVQSAWKDAFSRIVD